MSPLEFIVASIATWRITHMIREEQGPFDIIRRFRDVFIKETKSGTETRWVIGELISCFFCLSVWVAAVFAILLSSGIVNFLLYTCGISGVAILLNTFFLYFEE